MQLRLAPHGRFEDRASAVKDPSSSRGHVGVDLSQVRTGMDVADIRGSIIGIVKEVRTADFLVNRRLLRDLYVPVDAIYVVMDDALILSVRAASLDSMGWQRPPLWHWRKTRA
jgi:hypothetical protein